MPCPKNKNGFIDEGELWKLAYGKLQLPLGSLDDLSPLQLVWITEGHFEAEREQYEINIYSIFYAMRYANSDKKEFKNPFGTQQESHKEISKEQRDEQIAEINSIFE